MPAKKPSTTRLTKDFESEKAKKDKAVSATPPQMTHLSPNLLDNIADGYDEAAYPNIRDPTSTPTASLDSCIED